MASKAFSLSSLTSILLILLNNTALTAESNSSAFDFLVNLQGHRKGGKVQGIHDLKKYLHRFGYLNYPKPSSALDNNFDDELESAVKTYQLNYHLNPTGILDPKTGSQMRKPRCGVPDIINGRTRMESGKIPNFHSRKTHNSTSKLRTVSHFTLVEGNPTWPPEKYHLTYGFEENTLPAAVLPVKRAFGKWEAISQFTFEITEFFDDADLRVNFYRGDHGDDTPFDGPEGILAHAMPPEGGRFHYDADENWAAGAKDGAYDLESVALHEIGHLLGLAHSSVEDAVMFAGISPGQVKQITEDGIQGIRTLYNL